jgi:hypothetical protein
MKTAEQFVNEECAVYNTEALIAAVEARDRELVERCAQAVADASRPHWVAARNLDDLDDAEVHETVALALEGAAQSVRALIPKEDSHGA